MSMYLAIEQGEPCFLASNWGWGNLCRFVDTLPVEIYGELASLCEHGISEHLPQVGLEITQALQEDATPDVQSSLKDLLDLVSGEPADAVAVVTNGFTAEEPADAQPFRG